MKRTTIMADEETLGKLRDLARDKGVSFAEVARQALAEKAEELRPRLTSLGTFDSGRSDTSELASDPIPPRSWR